MYYAICYVSTIKTSLDNTDLLKLFKQTEEANNKNNISGILLHNTGNFLQYMEGYEEHIKKLYYSQVALDSRHHNSIVLFENSIDAPYFVEYQAGFTSVAHKSSVQKLITYLNLLKYVNSKEMEVLSKTVNSFLT